MKENQNCASNVSIVIPAYNEERSIGSTLTKLLAEPELATAEIIVIDDGSKDKTSTIVDSFPNVLLYRHHINLGYGAAISTGIRQSTRPYVVWFDADNQHRVEDLLTVIYTLINNQLDYCIGVRGVDSYEVANRRLGKAILRMTIRLVAGQTLEDFNSGLRGFKFNVISSYLHLLPKGFSASTTTSLLMLERNHLGTTVPILVDKRVGQSSVKQIRDGFRTLLVIFRILVLFKPLLFFGGFSIILILFGVIYGFSLAFTSGRGFPVLAALSIILGIQLLFLGVLSDQISLLRRERFEVLDTTKRGKHEHNN